MQNYKVTTGIFEGTLFKGTELNGRIINNDTTGQSYPKENCKIVIADNLCKLTYTVNRTFVKSPIYKANGDKFVIEKPTNFRLSCVSPAKMEQITKIYKSLELMHSVKYYPVGYFSGQKTPLYDIEIDLGYSAPLNFQCDLIEFGSSFGMIEFEGEEFNLSHSGGTGGDFTDMFTIVGKSVEFAKLVEKKFKEVRK